MQISLYVVLYVLSETMVLVVAMLGNFAYSSTIFNGGNEVTEHCHAAADAAAAAAVVALYRTFFSSGRNTSQPFNAGKQNTKC